MASFTIRVELRGNPTYERYEGLHKLMMDMGFKRWIIMANSVGKYKAQDLPHATYYGESMQATSSLLTSVVNSIRSKVQQDIVVFVAQSTSYDIYPKSWD